jgi:hypothetical protein
MLRNISVTRLTVISAKAFESVIAKFNSQVGHPDAREFSKASSAAKTYAELAEVVGHAVGPSDLMVFLRLDIGRVVGLAGRVSGPKAVRYIIGNPLIMKQMAEHVIDAGAYAPVTV